MIIEVRVTQMAPAPFFEKFEKKEREEKHV
jgi:hypothetical protein